MMKIFLFFLLCLFTQQHSLNANAAVGANGETSIPENPFVEYRKNHVPPEIAIFDWVRSHGGIVDGLAIFQPKDKPRGLYTTKQFKNSSILLSIPNEVMIHRGFVLDEAKNPAFAAFFKAHLEHSSFPGDDCALCALYIMFEMFYNRGSTIIGPYLDLLPLFDTNFQYFSYLPSFWSTEIKDLFNTLPSSKFEFAERENQIKQIQAYVENMLYPYVSKEYIVKDVNVLYSQYRWAMSIVQSRAWGGLGIKERELEEEDETLVPPTTKITGTCTVVPLADMLNHRTEAMALSGVRDNVEGKSYFIGHGLQAIKDMDAGEEVYDNYSPLPETELCSINILITFGFIDPDPGYDCYEFTLNNTFNSDPKINEYKLALFKAFGVSSRLTVRLRGSTIDRMREIFPEEYLVFLRIASVTTYEEFKVGMSVADGIKAGRDTRKTAWTLGNEHKALRSMKQHAIQIDKNEFATSVEEDTEILQLIDVKLNDTSLSHKNREALRQQKLIVELRRREHLVMHTLIEFADERWMSLLNAKILNEN